jgi:hypothetical protein
MRHQKLKALLASLLVFAAGTSAACQLEPYRWSAPQVQIYTTLDPLKWHQAFTRSYRAWNAVGSRITLDRNSGLAAACLTEGTNTTAVGTYVCGRPFDPNVLAITLVYYNANGGATHGAIIYNANVKFDTYSGPKRPGVSDFGRVTLHEMGHFLGLQHESRVDSIMNPTEGNRDTLSNDDIQCLKRIYP